MCLRCAAEDGYCGGSECCCPCHEQGAIAGYPLALEPLARWPGKDEPGEFIAGCSCGEWSATGTAEEISKASGLHDDSPWRNHVVSIRYKVVTDEQG